MLPEVLMEKAVGISIDRPGIFTFCIFPNASPFTFKGSIGTVLLISEDSIFSAIIIMSALLTEASITTWNFPLSLPSKELKSSSVSVYSLLDGVFKAPFTNNSFDFSEMSAAIEDISKPHRSFIQHSFIFKCKSGSRKQIESTFNLLISNAIWLRSKPFGIFFSYTLSYIMQVFSATKELTPYSFFIRLAAIPPALTSPILAPICILSLGKCRRRLEFDIANSFAFTHHGIGEEVVSSITVSFSAISNWALSINIFCRSAVEAFNEIFPTGEPPVIKSLPT